MFILILIPGVSECSKNLIGPCMGVCLWASIVSRGVDDGVSHNGRTVTPNARTNEQERTNDREAAACIAPDLFTSCVVVSCEQPQSAIGTSSI
jgi:hypothetical protein